MSIYSKYNVVYQLQKWMDSVAGQTFLNYAYSWGAAVVILGALFKLTHMPGADLMLFLGMGTEVVVFILYAFDRPFDMTAEGMELEHGNSVDAAVSISHTSPVSAPDNALLELLNTRLAEMEKLNKRISDGKETDEIKEVMTAIHQVYQQQLVKLSSQLTSIDKMDDLFKIQNAYLMELNKIYARILDAMGGKNKTCDFNLN